MGPRGVALARSCSIAACLLSAGPVPTASAFSPEVLDSVVTVLPSWPEGRQAQPEEPQGSAVAIAPNGHLVTALHVVDRAIRIRVRLANGLQLDARLVGRDPPTDLALLKIETDLPVLTPGPPPGLGDPVCAVGNPFGTGLSVSCGVVSGVNRTGMGFNPIEDFIQTDAAVNPGMSGGALVDSEGRFIGMLSAIFTRNVDGDIGLNFAASAKLVERVVFDLVSHGAVIRVNPGFRVGPLRPGERNRLAGVRLTSLLADGAGAQAGLEVGDILTRVGGREVRKPSDVITAIQLRRPGEAVEIEFLRDGNASRLTLVLPQ